MIRLTAVIDLEGQTRALTHESNSKAIVIGRDASADFRIPLTTVSRAHARIAETDNAYVFEDLGSTHGSMLNGKRIGKGEKKVLRDGDIIELTKARITCNIEMDKVVQADAGESTRMIADKALAGILGRLGPGEGENPFFRVLSGPDEDAKLELSGKNTEWTLGRSNDCEFVLNDANVSRRHAVVKKDWNGFTIQDLGSKNGVIVNDRKITRPRRLRDRDEIVIGPIKLLFVDPDADLMEALSDVPGFEQDLGEEELEDEASVMGAPGEEADGVAEGGVEAEDGEESEAEGEEGAEAAVEDEYANIDPELLEAPERKFPIEWVIVGLVGTLVLVCGAFLAVLLI